MQKAFGWIERVLIGLAIIGFMLILTSTLGGASILILSLVFLSLLYFVGGYFQPTPDGKVSAKLALIKIASGLTLSVLVIGLLFKIMLWNGAAIMLLIGLVGTAMAGLIAFALLRAGYSLTGVLRRSAVWMGLGALLLLSSTTALFELHHPDDPVMSEKFRAKEAHPGDPRYQTDFDEYRRQRQAQQHNNN